MNPRRWIMKSIFLAFVACGLVFLSGCSNFSPRNNGKIQNQNGRIDEIKNNQNGIIADVDLLKNQQEIQNSQLDRIQQGMMNLQNIYENSGVQVFSGPGGLMAGIVGFVCVTIVMLHYRSQAKSYEKTANLLADKIVGLDNSALEEEIFKAATQSNVEEKVLSLVKKHKLMR